MKKPKKNISILLVSIFWTLILLLGGDICYQILDAKRTIATQLPILLEEAIRKNIQQKSEEVYYSGTYKYDPKEGKVGEYEMRTAIYADTTFTYRRKIHEPGESKFQGLQTLLVDIKQLHADSIQLIFDSLLVDRNIIVNSIIGIEASYYTQLDEWSNDTTAIAINYRTSFLKQGNYEDINYYAYMHYSPYTFWRLMSKTPIFILFVAAIFIGLIWRWWTCKYKKDIALFQERMALLQKRRALLQEGKYHIENSVYNKNDMKLTTGEKEVKLTRQLHEMLLLFLETANRKVKKKDIQERFWPDNSNPMGNMTSCINRLNKTLKDNDCDYTIITDSENEDHYLLSREK